MAPSTAGGGSGLVWSNQARAGAASERHARTARGGEGGARDRDRNRGGGDGEGSSGGDDRSGGRRRTLPLMRHAAPKVEAPPPPPRHPYTRQEGDTSQVEEAS